MLIRLIWQLLSERFIEGTVYYTVHSSVLRAQNLHLPPLVTDMQAGARY